MFLTKSEEDERYSMRESANILFKIIIYLVSNVGAQTLSLLKLHVQYAYLPTSTHRQINWATQ